jgi:hypothetical protein
LLQTSSLVRDLHSNTHNPTDEEFFASDAFEVRHVLLHIHVSLLSRHLRIHYELLARMRTPSHARVDLGAELAEIQRALALWVDVIQQVPHFRSVEDAHFLNMFDEIRGADIT